MILLDIDPNVVKPGWTPLVITVLLAAAIVLLYFSMRRQVRRINVLGSQAPAADDTADEATDVAPSEVPGPDADDAPTPSTAPSSTPTG